MTDYAGLWSDLCVRNLNVTVTCYDAMNWVEGGRGEVRNLFSLDPSHSCMCVCAQDSSVKYVKSAFFKCSDKLNMNCICIMRPKSAFRFSRGGLWWRREYNRVTYTVFENSSNAVNVTCNCCCIPLATAFWVILYAKLSKPGIHCILVLIRHLIFDQTQ
jgi:hypothetical protein